jgi:hypothetical protein
MDMIGDISHHLSRPIAPVGGNRLISARLLRRGCGYSQPVRAPSFTQQTAGNSGSGDAQQGNPGYGVVNKIARRDPDAAKIRA